MSAAGADAPLVLSLGQQPYPETFTAMRAFTESRQRGSRDEIWLLQHPSVFTLGQAGKPEHLLAPGDIPVVQSNRGGQVTYHGPGQLVAYVMLDLQGRGYGIRSLVTRMENALIACMADFGITASARQDAPGVYLDDGRKLASLGLRVSRGFCYHGLALNVAMNLEPFQRINPCGHAGLQVAQLSEIGGPKTVIDAEHSLIPHLRDFLYAPD
ncbi:lipoyl(octanoyl) transferase LipB [Banduia mediterranea]|uniref:lipoyl(octanoyl) transferase LipB n=1 Tax=Banduia mediterranea TaxID=3075609 RepID=UPI003D773F5F